MDPKLLTTADWQKAAKGFNFKDTRVPKKIAEFEKMARDTYDERIRCLAELRHLAKLLPTDDKNAEKLQAELIKQLDKEQASLVRAKAAARAQKDNTFTPQEAANLLKKVKFSGLKWDPKNPQQGVMAIEKAIKGSHWTNQGHFPSRVIERGAEYLNIHDGDDLQAAIQRGRSEPDEDGKFNHHLPGRGIIVYNPSARTFVTLV